MMLLALWWLAVLLGDLPSFLLPSPGQVVARLASDLVNPSLWPAVGLTLAEALGGCALGSAVALPLAILIHRSAWVSAAVSPFLGATQAIPAIALAPLLVFFPILVASVVGLRHVDASIVDAARMDGAGSLALLRHIELPLALPSILGGFRNGFTLSVTGAVVGEMVMGGAGLGMLLTVQRDSVDTAGMFSTITVLCALASLAYSLILLVERRSRVMQSLRGGTSP